MEWLTLFSFSLRLLCRWVKRMYLCTHWVRDATHTLSIGWQQQQQQQQITSPSPPQIDRSIRQTKRWKQSKLDLNGDIVDELLSFPFLQYNKSRKKMYEQTDSANERRGMRVRMGHIDIGTYLLNREDPSIFYSKLWPVHQAMPWHLMVIYICGQNEWMTAWFLFALYLSLQFYILYSFSITDQSITHAHITHILSTLSILCGSAPGHNYFVIFETVISTLHLSIDHFVPPSRYGVILQQLFLVDSDFSLIFRCLFFSCSDIYMIITDITEKHATH